MGVSVRERRGERRYEPRMSGIEVKSAEDCRAVEMV